MKIVLSLFFVGAKTAGATSFEKGFLDESLDIYQFKDGEHALLDFTYRFSKAKDGDEERAFGGLYPDQFDSLFE